MIPSSRLPNSLAVLCGLAASACFAPPAGAIDLLVADRLTNSVYRYGQTGEFLGTVLSDSVNINQAVGVALSRDLTTLYVSSFQNGRVMKYDYDHATGAANNPQLFASGLEAPNAILVAEDGNTIYVSNLGGLGVSRFHTDGSSAGPPLLFPPPSPGSATYSQFSGLAFAPDGSLLVGAFLDSPGGTTGAVGQWNGAGDSLAFLVDPHTSLIGTSGLLAHQNHVYASAMFAGNIQRFSLADGERDPSFSITGLGFPQGLVPSPDGNGFLAGVLGFANGQGRIAHFGFDGQPVGDGVFALPGGGGFNEATALAVVPDRLPGDFNNNGVVDAADYIVWRTKLGSSYHLHGNGNETGASRHIVDRDDYLLWKDNYGASAQGSNLGVGASHVPEPGSAALAAGLGWGCLVLAPRRRATRHVRTS